MSIDWLTCNKDWKRECEKRRERERERETTLDFLLFIPLSKFIIHFLSMFTTFHLCIQVHFRTTHYDDNYHLRQSITFVSCCSFVVFFVTFGCHSIIVRSIYPIYYITIFIGKEKKNVLLIPMNVMVSFYFFFFFTDKPVAVDLTCSFKSFHFITFTLFLFPVYCLL